MKIMHSRARQLEIAVFFYSPARGSRPNHRAVGNFWSRVRGSGSGHPVFGRSIVSSLWPCYVWEFGGFLCLAFFVVSLLCNHNKIL